MRVFAAVRPAEEAAEHLDEFLEARRSAGGFRWTPADQFHVTLAFVGEAAERRLDEYAERLADAAARRAAFDVAIAGGGAFPDVGRGQVLWADLDLAEPARRELDRLAVGARNAAVTAGLEVDGQRFRPHLTLARCRPTELTSWVRLLDAYRGPPWRVDRIALVASYLGECPRRRPRHETLAELPLGDDVVAG